MKVAAIASRYLTVGAACAALNALVLIGGDALGLPLAASIAASFAIVCLAGYRLHAAITFDAPADARGFARYVLAMAAALPVSAALLWLFARVLGWPMVAAAPAATIGTLVVNIVSTRWAILCPARLRPSRIAS